MGSLINVINYFEDKLRDNELKIGNTTYQFELLDDVQSVFYIVLKDGKGTVFHGKHHNPDVTLQMTESHLEALIAGKLNPTIAYMTGKLKVKGDIAMALKLQALLS